MLQAKGQKGRSLEGRGEEEGCSPCWLQAATLSYTQLVDILADAFFSSCHLLISSLQYEEEKDVW